jgi:iron(III) transport system substrate-binding protein
LENARYNDNEAAMTHWETFKARVGAVAKVALTLGAVAYMQFGTAVSAMAAGDAAAFAKLVEAAKREGNVVVDGPPIDTVRTALTAAFKEKYGITVSYISSGSSKSGARVRAERAGEKYLLDVFISGADTPLLTFKASNWLERIEPILIDPDVADPSKWTDNHIWYEDPEHTILRLFRYATPNLAINTKVVGPNEITKWADLVDPKWQGKIAAKDPALSGAGASLISYFYLFFGPDFVKKLYQDQKPFISREPRQAVQWLAQGTYPIVVGPDQNELKRFADLQYPVGPVFPTDGPGIVSGGWGIVALLNKAPNPNAAKLFVNWLASKEGLEVFGRATISPTLRKDVPTDWAPVYTVPVEGKKYVDTYEYDFVIKQRDVAFDKVQKLLGL